jgi:putative oxidoreductase
MKYAIVISRVLLGLIFVVFGLNGFLHFLGPMPEMQGQAGAFITALASSGYFYVIAFLQVLGGLCLLLGARFVPLGLTLLGPVIVNIVLYHLFLDQDPRLSNGDRRLGSRFVSSLDLPLQVSGDLSAVEFVSTADVADNTDGEGRQNNAVSGSNIREIRGPI